MGSNETGSQPEPHVWAFDYRTSVLPPTTGLCYTRCTWAVVEGQGVVLDRAPGTCWEGAHNALLQAAAPALYEALRALLRGEVGAMGRAEATLKEVEDQAWLDFLGNPGTAEFNPQQVMEMACGLGG